MDSDELRAKQDEICRRFGVVPMHVPLDLKIGIAENVKTGLLPLNGLRHPPVGDTTGWYIWAGEDLSDDPDFFLPLHVKHLLSWRPEVMPYLALPPGWRFLITPDFEDVWEDSGLLRPSEVAH